MKGWTGFWSGSQTGYWEPEQVALASFGFQPWDWSHGVGLRDVRGSVKRFASPARGSIPRLKAEAAWRQLFSPPPTFQRQARGIVPLVPKFWPGNQNKICRGRPLCLPCPGCRHVGGPPIFPRPDRATTGGLPLHELVPKLGWAHVEAVDKYHSVFQRNNNPSASDSFSHKKILQG